MSSGATVTKAEPKEALVFLSDVRAQLKDSFDLNANTKEDQLNIEHNIMKIRALLTVNREIFFRCMKHTVGTFGEKTTIQRFGIRTIKTLQVDTKLELVTQGERVERTFDTSPLSRLPSGFVDIIVVKCIPTTKCIDFDDIFRKTLLLNDDALEFLLPKLKEHLETVQVCLGVLDEWLMQPMKNELFINSFFETRCTIPSKKFYSRRSQCCFCGSPFVPTVVFKAPEPGRKTALFAIGEDMILLLVYITVNALVYVIYFKFWLKQQQMGPPLPLFFLGLLHLLCSIS